MAEKKHIISVIVIIASIISVSIIILFIINNMQQQPTPYYSVDTWIADKTYNGTTLFADVSNGVPKIVEVNMQGEIVWQWTPPSELHQYINPGLDTERLPSGNTLVLLPQKGIYEINSSGDIVWYHLDEKCSHDADRLPNGNTIYIWGGNDSIDDNQVKEVNLTHHLVWNWTAKPHFYNDTYKDIFREGWTHANAVTRIPGTNNTLINLRNFNMTIVVNKTGNITWSYNWTDSGTDPHEPELLSNDNLVIALQWEPKHTICEINRTTKTVVWNYTNDSLRTSRDADRLPNNNTLIQSVINDDNSSVIMEVTKTGEIVWQFTLRNNPATHSPGWFYKAQRIP